MKILIGLLGRQTRNDTVHAHLAAQVAPVEQQRGLRIQLRVRAPSGCANRCTSKARPHRNVSATRYAPMAGPGYPRSPASSPWHRAVRGRGRAAASARTARRGSRPCPCARWPATRTPAHISQVHLCRSSEHPLRTMFASPPRISHPPAADSRDRYRISPHWYPPGDC